MFVETEQLRNTPADYSKDNLEESLIERLNNLFEHNPTYGLEISNEGVTMTYCGRIFTFRVNVELI